MNSITYIRADGGWLSLAILAILAILADLFSRRIVGWALSHRGHSW